MNVGGSNCAGVGGAGTPVPIFSLGHSLLTAPGLADPVSSVQVVPYSSSDNLLLTPQARWSSTLPPTALLNSAALKAAQRGCRRAQVPCPSA